MKKIIITIVVSVVVGLGVGWLIFHSGSKTNATTERKILYYRDPMNPQNTSPTPKKAPDGMDYVPVYDESSGSGGERKIAYYKDPMHPWYTSDKPGKAPDCGMDLVPVYEDEGNVQGIKINPATIQNMGVKVEAVERRKLSKTIRTTGKIDYDERKVYSINTKTMGWVEKLYVDYTGKVVHKGDPLIELYSPELVTTQEEYLQALKYRKALQQSTLDEAKKGSDDLIQSVRRRLLYWDIPESEIKVLEERGTPNKTMTIYSPVDGIVMEKMVQKGQNIMAGMELYKIADLSTVWVLADIYQYELPWVKLGQNVEIELSYLAGKIFKGKITYIYPYLSEETKTAKVRVEVPNTTGLELKPDMYATVKIVSPLSVNAVAVPDQAIIRSGERNIVVIALGGGYFDPREVKLGISANGYVQILDGIKAGEKIVISSQFLIDSESNLKAVISQMSSNTGISAGSSVRDTSKLKGQTKIPADELVMPMQSTEHAGHKGKRKTVETNTPSHQQKQTEMNDMQMNMKETTDSASAPPSAVKIKSEALKHIDPVCGMEADPSGKYNFTYEGRTYYFCSKEDMEKFKKDPSQYVPHDHH
jgi:Cu(I)/Ag(I) efflux system membrane fusion protein